MFSLNEFPQPILFYFIHTSGGESGIKFKSNLRIRNHKIIGNQDSRIHIIIIEYNNWTKIQYLNKDSYERSEKEKINNKSIKPNNL